MEMDPIAELIHGATTGILVLRLPHSEHLPGFVKNLLLQFIKIFAPKQLCRVANTHRNRRSLAVTTSCSIHDICPAGIKLLLKGISKKSELTNFPPGNYSVFLTQHKVRNRHHAGTPYEGFGAAFIVLELQ